MPRRRRHPRRPGCTWTSGRRSSPGRVGSGAGGRRCPIPQAVCQLHDEGPAVKGVRASGRPGDRRSVLISPTPPRGRTRSAWGRRRSNFGGGRQATGWQAEPVSANGRSVVSMCQMAAVTSRARSSRATLGRRWARRQTIPTSARRPGSSSNALIASSRAASRGRSIRSIGPASRRSSPWGVRVSRWRSTVPASVGSRE